MERLAGGDYQAFHRLFESYHPRVWQFIRSMVKSDIVADDLSQDVFVKIWIHREAMPQVRHFDAYVFGMARNAVKDHIKGNVVRDRHLNRTNLYSRDYVLPDEEYDAKETELIVKFIVSKMPEQRRRTFTMSRYEGLRNEEIAEKLNISKKTVENHINAALTDIRKGLPILIALFAGQF